MERLRRRQFLRVSLPLLGLGVFAGCGLAPPRTLPTARLPRLGYLAPGSPVPSPLDDAFLHGLGEHGYVEGRDIALERRGAEGNDERMPELAAQLVGLKVDLLVVVGPPATRAAKEATETIPIVMVAGSTDPVADGLVTSVARPGGNLTGLAVGPTELYSEKRLALLKEALPDLRRVAMLLDRNVAPGPLLPQSDRTLAAARALGLELQPLHVRVAGDIQGAIQAAVLGQAGALLIMESPLLYLHRTEIVGMTARSHLPAIGLFREFVDAGGLMTYGASLAEMHRRAAVYADKILRGAKPADLPIEQPTRFDFVINLKAARAMGLTIPPYVLGQATEVIQ
jgi:putative tryptophan/tyrosine transport system substrate-binding protein